MVGNMKVLLINIADWYKSTEPGLWGKGQMMKRKKHTEEQIIATLKEYEAGMKTADLCRKYGISEAHLLQLESQVRRAGGLRGFRLKGLESENALSSMASASSFFSLAPGHLRCGPPSSPPNRAMQIARLQSSLDKTWGQRQH
jgi:putative transposase